MLGFFMLILMNSNSSGMRLPLDGDWTISRAFGAWINDPWYGYHLAEDVGRSSEVAVYAIAAGHVKFSQQHVPSYGYPVIIEHTLPDGVTKYCSLYGHLRSSGLIANNVDVTEGQLIGYLTSVSDDNEGSIHLHCGIRMGAYTSSNVYMDVPSTGWAWKWQWVGYTRNANLTQRQNEPYDITHEAMKSQWRAMSEFVAQNGQADVYQIALATSPEGGSQFIDGVETTSTTMIAGGATKHFKVRYKNLCNFTWSKTQSDPNFVGLMSCESNGSTVCHSFLNDPWNSSLGWMTDADHAHVTKFNEAYIVPGQIATFEFDGYVRC